MILQALRNERYFLYILATLSIITALVFQNPAIAMWMGFAMAGYSAIANDSIQTLGTFLATNKKQPWWVLWWMDTQYRLKVLYVYFLPGVALVLVYLIFF